MDGGIQISTATALAAVGSLIGIIGTLLKVIQSQNTKANEDTKEQYDKRLIEQEAQYAARLADRDRTIEDHKDRIRKMEDDIRTQNAILTKSIDALERAGDILERTTSATEEVVRKVPVETSRRRGT